MFLPVTCLYYILQSHGQSAPQSRKGKWLPQCACDRRQLWESVATHGGPAQAGQGAGWAQMLSPAFSLGDVRPALKGGA